MYDVKSFEDDYVWVHENRDQLVREYKNRWIGVRNHRVIASDPEYAGLLSGLADPAHTVVEFISGQPMETVL